jgi:hypothetical protein
VPQASAILNPQGSLVRPQPLADLPITLDPQVTSRRPQVSREPGTTTSGGVLGSGGVLDSGDDPGGRLSGWWMFLAVICALGLLAGVAIAPLMVLRGRAVGGLANGPVSRGSGGSLGDSPATSSPGGASSGSASPATSGPVSGGCTATYQPGGTGPGGFLGSVVVTNTGTTPINGWSVGVAMGASRLVAVWNGVNTGTTGAVTVTNASSNAGIAAGGAQMFGFIANGDSTGGPTVTSCTAAGSSTGPTRPRTTPVTTTPVATGVVATTPVTTAPLATSPTTPTATGTPPPRFTWSSSGALISPKPDASHPEAGVKDPSVVYYNGKWHVFASVASANGYNLEYRSFTDWSQAGSARPYFLDRSGIGIGYRAAPEVFYFAPQELWYLVFQTGNASYSTNPDISNPAGWSAPKNFYSGMPSIISQNIGNGYWVDMWVICDDANCYLFSSDDNGHLYRSQTSLANFPNGMSQPVIALQDSNRYNLFEVSNVYKVQGKDEYLLIVEALGSRGRYFRSWTSSSPGGSWTPLAAAESSPFAGANNVTFSGNAWTTDISHGEMIRAGYDHTLTISPCKMQYLYQGRDPNSGGDYNTLPWKLGLLTRTNSTCS